MSRIGRKPIAAVQGRQGSNARPGILKVTGPKGELSATVHPSSSRSKSRTRPISRSSAPRTRRPTGRCTGSGGRSSRTWCAASPKGFSRKLELVGVGYSAELKGKNLQFALGLLPPDPLHAAGGDQDRDAPADEHHHLAGSTSSWSARSPRRSARSGRRSRTRARA